MADIIPLDHARRRRSRGRPLTIGGLLDRAVEKHIDSRCRLIALMEGIGAEIRIVADDLRASDNYMRAVRDELDERRAA